MATFTPHLQKTFKLTYKQDLPEATVEQMGVTHWLRCCPLCGSVHQIQNMAKDQPYTPLCQTHPELFKAELLAWRKLYPDVTQYTSVCLVEKAA